MYYAKPPISRSSGYEYWDDGPLTPELTIYESGERFSGLFDANGNELWKHKQPIGFNLTGDFMATKKKPIPIKKPGGGNKC